MVNKVKYYSTVIKQKLNTPWEAWIQVDLKQQVDGPGASGRFVVRAFGREAGEPGG